MLRELKQSKIREYLNFPQFSYFVKDCDRMLDRSHLRKESFHLGSCFRGCQFILAEGVVGCGEVAPRGSNSLPLVLFTAQTQRSRKL